MVASATRGPDQECQPTRTARHGIRRVAKWVAIVLALVAFATFVTAGTSQACPANGASSLQLTAQGDTRPSATVYNPTLDVAQPSSVAPWNIGFARGPCCGDSPGHYHSPAGAGSCCSACTAAVIGADYFVGWNPTLHLVVMPLQTCSSPVGFGGQFRPPRTTL